MQPSGRLYVFGSGGGKTRVFVFEAGVMPMPGVVGAIPSVIDIQAFQAIILGLAPLLVLVWLHKYSFPLSY